LTEGQQYVRFNGVQVSASGQIAIAFAIRSGQTYGEMAGMELETVSLGNPQPVLLQQARLTGTAVQLTATGLDPASRYVLTRSANLCDAFPTVVGTAISPAGTSAVLTDPAQPPSEAFYRLEILP
jgi:hypothetical protein